MAARTGFGSVGRVEVWRGGCMSLELQIDPDLARPIISPFIRMVMLGLGVVLVVMRVLLFVVDDLLRGLLQIGVEHVGQAAHHQCVSQHDELDCDTAGGLDL